MVKPKEPRRGRPPLPKGSTKAHVLKIRITDAERRAVEAQATKEGKSLSEWIRARLRLGALLKK